LLTDGLGRQVAVPSVAQRVVSLAPSNTEILFAVGAGGQLVGRDEISDYPPEAQQVTSIGSTYGALNSEAILALEADLILGADITSPEQVQALESLGLTVFVLSNPTDFEGLFANLEMVGDLTGHATEAGALSEALRSRVEAVAQATQGAPRPTVYYEVDGTDPTAPWTTGSGTFQSLLIELAGGQNVAEDMQGWGQISLEQLVARDPGVIIIGLGPWVPTTPEGLAERSGWGEIAAVKQGAVFGIDANWVDRPGPRLVDALEAMARYIHPELFE
jgi:iron complex transport system substrate-binding protein